MAKLTGAKEKTQVAMVAMDLGLHEFASQLMTTVSAVEVPQAALAVMEKALAREAYLEEGPDLGGSRAHARLARSRRRRGGRRSVRPLLSSWQMETR
jgi:hypothetical protein